MSADARGAAGDGASPGRLAAALAGPGPKLVAYLTSGDPSEDVTVDLVLAAAEAGADVIELGVPFSEPSADGPAIQAAMERALARGASLDGALEVVRRVRARSPVPIVLFGYYNPIFVHGVERFVARAAEAGADGLLVVDLPIDELDELAGPARAAGLDVVPLLAPTSTAARIARVAALGAPFVYYISMTGVTGAALAGGTDELAARVARVRAAVGAPVAVGFGIATAEDARRIGTFADAIVVGSAIVRAIAAAPGREAAAVRDLVGALKGALAGLGRAG